MTVVESGDSRGNTACEGWAPVRGVYVLKTCSDYANKTSKGFNAALWCNPRSNNSEGVQDVGVHRRNLSTAAPEDVRKTL